MKYAVIDRMGDDKGHALIKEIHHDTQTAIAAAERLSKEAYLDGYAPQEIDFAVMEFKYLASIQVLAEPKTSINWAQEQVPPKKREKLLDWICRKPGDVFCSNHNTDSHDNEICKHCDHAVRR